MGTWRVHGVLSALLVTGLTMTGCTAAATTELHPSPAAGSSSPAAISANASVGPLFANGLGGGHSCTGSVVDSPAGNIVMTAAHCVHGTGAGLLFAPGYSPAPGSSGGSAPYGTWTVQAAYGAPSWMQRQDPDEDYAFLIVAPSSGNSNSDPVQAVVGGHSLSTATDGPPTASSVNLRGYVSTSDSLLSCATKLSYTAEFPTVTCVGFGDGTSGSPWISSADSVFGVTGGKDQGGCTTDLSYAAPLGPVAIQAWQRAVDRTGADSFPAAGRPAC
jgi:V8-like Glu-specific endopeptidase